MTKTIGFVKVQFLLVLIMLFVMLTGCDAYTSEVNSDDPSYEETRISGKVYNGTLQETMHTAFFDFNLKSCTVERYVLIENSLYEPPEGYVFIVCDVELYNHRNIDMEMYLDEFPLYWNLEEETCAYGYGGSKLESEQYLNEFFTMEPEAKVEGKILYAVKETGDYWFVYEECYEDGFIGNVHRIHVTESDLQ